MPTCNPRNLKPLANPVLEMMVITLVNLWGDNDRESEVGDRLDALML